MVMVSSSSSLLSDEDDDETNDPPARELVVDPPHQSDTSLMISPMPLAPSSINISTEKPLIEENEKQLKEEEASALPVELEGGTTIPIQLQSFSEADSSIIVESCEKVPDITVFSNGIQPFTPFQNLPGCQGGYSRVRDTLKRAKENPTHFTILGDTTSTPVKHAAASNSIEEVANKRRKSSSRSHSSHSRREENVRGDNNSRRFDYNDSASSSSYRSSNNRRNSHQSESDNNRDYGTRYTSHPNDDYHNSRYENNHNIHSDTSYPCGTRGSTRDYPSNSYCNNVSTRDFTPRQHGNNQAYSNWQDNGHGYPTYPSRMNKNLNNNNQDFHHPSSRSYYR